MHSCKRVSNVGSGLGLSWGAQHGAAAGLVRRCQFWTNGADLRGAERGNCMPQYKTAQSRRNVREPAGVPPWAGSGFKNFGHQLGKKTKQRFRAPPVPGHSTFRKRTEDETFSSMGADEGSWTEIRPSHPANLGWDGRGIPPSCFSPRRARPIAPHRRTRST